MKWLQAIIDITEDSSKPENQDKLCHVATNIKILEQQGMIY